MKNIYKASHQRANSVCVCVCVRVCTCMCYTHTMLTVGNLFTHRIPRIVSIYEFVLNPFSEHKKCRIRTRQLELNNFLVKKKGFLILILCLSLYDFVKLYILYICTHIYKIYVYIVLLIYFVIVPSDLQVPKNTKLTSLPSAFIVSSYLI